MGESSKIEWTDHTFNPWWGCAKVSAGCKNCYAATWADRFGKNVWGINAPREAKSDANWRKPLKWNRDARRDGVRRRVFCASMADVFERRGNHNDDAQLEEHRARLWHLIEETPALDWLLLTKRPENIVEMVPRRWLGCRQENVWVGTTVENASTLPRLNELLIARAEFGFPVAFCSYEPALGPVDFAPALAAGLDWLIVGGESGPGAREFDIRWARSAIRACRDAGRACFVKQLGLCASDPANGVAGAGLRIPPDARQVIGGVRRLTDRKGGDWSEWPVDLRVRQIPQISLAQVCEHIRQVHEQDPDRLTCDEALELVGRGLEGGDR